MNSWNLQQAIYAALNVGTLTSQLSAAYSPLVPIFDSVPDASVAKAASDTLFPFVTFGTVVTTPFDTKGKTGSNDIIQVDIWTRANSFQQAKQLADIVDVLLRRQPLSITGHITTELSTRAFMRDPDGKTKRAMTQYRVLVH